MSELTFAEELDRRARQRAELPPELPEPPEAEPAAVHEAVIVDAASYTGLVSYGQIAPEPTIYLSREHIILPRGHVVLVVGEAGIGKGTVIAWEAVQVARDGMLAGSPGTVIHISPEDDPRETNAWRFRANGAEQDELNRIFNMTVMPGGVPFSMDASGKTTGSIPMLSAKIGELKAAGLNPLLITIDPLRKCVRGGSIQTADGVSNIMIPLQELARRHGVCVMVSHHVTQAGKIAGSQELVNAARLVYLITTDRYDQRIKVARIYKTNIIDGYATEPARYIIEGEGKNAHVVWGRPIEAGPEYEDWRALAIATSLPAAIEGAPEPDPGETSEEAEEGRQSRAETDAMMKELMA